MKIFFNDKYFLFTKSKYASEKENGTLLVSDDGGLQFDELINDIEKSASVKQIVVTTKNIEDCFAEFSKHFKIIEAAGGLVKNAVNEYLLIYRNQKWDLPKGKIDSGETIKDAALREVKEECGLKNVTITSSLNETYHIYYIKNQRVLKRTYWFNMLSTDTLLTPQTDEGITEIKWMKKNEAKEKFKDSYGSISELIAQSID